MTTPLFDFETAPQDPPQEQPIFSFDPTDLPISTAEDEETLEQVLDFSPPRPSQGQMAASAQQLRERPARLKAFQENPQFLDMSLTQNNMEIMRLIDIDDLNQQIPPIVEDGGKLFGAMYQGLVNTGDVFNAIVDNPVEMGKGIFGAFLDLGEVAIKDELLRMFGAAAFEGSGISLPTQQEREVAELLAKPVAAGITGGLAGFLVGGPLGAAVGSILAAPAGVVDVESETPISEQYLTAVTEEFVFSVALIGGGRALKFGARAAASKGVSRLERLSPRAARAFDVSDVSDAQIDELVDLHRVGSEYLDTADDVVRPRTIADVETKGYRINEAPGGLIEIKHPDTGDVVGSGYFTPDELVNKLSGIPAIPGEAAVVTEALPYIELVRPGAVATMIEGVESFIITSFPKFFANAKSVFTEIQKLTAQAQRPIELLSEYVALDRVLGASVTRVVAKMRKFGTLGKQIDTAYSDLDDASRAAKLHDIGRALEVNSADQIASGAFSGTQLTGEALVIGRRMASLLRQTPHGNVIKIAHGVKEFLKKKRNLVEKQAWNPEARESLLAEVGNDLGDGASRELLEHWLDGLNRSSAELPMMEIIRYADALASGSPSRGKYLKNRGLNNKTDKIVLELAEQQFDELVTGTKNTTSRELRAAAQMQRRLGGVDAEVFTNVNLVDRVRDVNNLVRSGFSWNSERGLLQNLEKMIRNSEHAANVVDTLEAFTRRVRTAIKAGRIANTDLANSALSTLDSFRGIPNNDARLAMNAWINMFGGETSFGKFWQANSREMAEGFLAIMSTGLLGFRPSLAFRDVIDAQVTYGALVGNRRAARVFAKGWSRAGVQNRINGNGKWDDHTDALVASGDISDTQPSREIFDLSVETDSPTLSAMHKFYSRPGEVTSLQPYAFKTNQAIIFDDMFQESNRLSKQLIAGAIDEDEFIKRSGVLWQPPETIQSLVGLAKTNSGEFARRNARLITLDMLGQYGFGFGPAGRTLLDRGLFNFKNYPSTRRASISRMLSRGTPGQRAHAALTLTAFNGAVLYGAFGPLEMGWRATKYSNALGALYGGGPLADIYVDVLDGLSGFGRKGTSSALRMLVRILPFEGLRRDIMNTVELFE